MSATSSDIEDSGVNDEPQAAFHCLILMKSVLGELFHTRSHVKTGSHQFQVIADI